MRLFAGLSFLVLFYTNGFGQIQTSSSSSQDLASCGVDVRWLNTNGAVNRSKSSDVPEQLSLLIHMGRGAACSNAEVNLTVTYLTEEQDLICSGTIRSAMNVASQVQAINMGIRPFMQLDFVRWRNQPGLRGEQPGKRLACMNIDGTSDVGDADRQKAGWMRLTVGVVPAGGGLAVTEAIFRFVP